MSHLIGVTVGRDRHNRHKARGVLPGLEPGDAEFDSPMPDHRVVAQWEGAVFGSRRRRCSIHRYSTIYQWPSLVRHLSGGQEISLVQIQPGRPY
jgi:hypothetical protein